MRGGGTLKGEGGEKGWEWAGRGGGCTALAKKNKKGKKKANGEVLTHPPDISESVTAGPKGRDGM